MNWLSVAVGLFVASLAAAQPVPPARVQVQSGGAFTGRATTLNYDATDFAVTCTADMTCAFTLGPTVTELGSCIGESTDFCGAVDLSGTNTELPNAATTTSADCDVAGETGRVFVDSDDGQPYVCGGTRGWLKQAVADGVVGGQTIYGSPTTAQALTLDANSADNTGIVYLNSLTRVGYPITGHVASPFAWFYIGPNATVTLDSTVNQFLRVEGTYTVSGAVALSNSDIILAPTFNRTAAGAIVGYDAGLLDQSTYSTANGISTIGVNKRTVDGWVLLTAPASATSGGALWSYRTVDARPQINHGGTTGTNTWGEVSGLVMNAGMVPPASTASTVTTLRGFWMVDTTKTGAGTETLTTQIGADIAALSAGGTNIGIRNASSTVYTPSTAQTLAAGTATLANATIVQINSAGNVTITAAPSVADGQDGQILTIINVDTADTITYQDQGTLGASNLRLSATGIALGPRDSLTLTYNSTVGDWVQLSTSNVL